MNNWLKKVSYTRIIALSFLVVILTGSVLLTLPVSSRDRSMTPFADAVFTATSATCVTGLVVRDTGTYWSVFGQLVILGMIQIGGLGFMTIISMFSIFMKRKISLSERRLLMQSAGNMRLSGMVKLVKQIVKGTAVFELAGSVLLAIRFVPKFGFARGVYYAVFHSVSAFCNAGFDLMGGFQSFTAYEGDVLVNLTLMVLITSGGLGFLVWNEIYTKGRKFGEYSLHAKLVLVTTLFLFAVGTGGFLIFESNGNLANDPFPKKLLSAAFMSVTTRTAGFNTMDLTGLSQAGTLLAMVLMFIGGSPGSTAGGVKTTTVAVILFAMVNMSRGREDVTIFKKRLEDSVVKHAAVIVFVYLTGVLIAGMIMGALETKGITEIMFEIISAAGTVGLSKGITQTLSDASKLILIVMMYGGRIGGLSLLMVFREKAKEAPVRRPTEKILIG